MALNVEVAPILSTQDPAPADKTPHIKGGNENTPNLSKQDPVLDTPDTENANGVPKRDNQKDDSDLAVFSRPGPEGESDKTEPTNGVKKPLEPAEIPAGLFPSPPPSVGIDIDVGGIDRQSIPDVNVYQHKKTLAQGMMDLALFSANANQLRYVLESFSGNPYYYPSVVLISFSLLMQVSDMTFLQL